MEYRACALGLPSYLVAIAFPCRPVRFHVRIYSRQTSFFVYSLARSTGTPTPHILTNIPRRTYRQSQVVRSEISVSGEMIHSTRTRPREILIHLGCALSVHRAVLCHSLASRPAMVSDLPSCFVPRMASHRLMYELVSFAARESLGCQSPLVSVRASFASRFSELSHSPIVSCAGSPSRRQRSVARCLFHPTSGSLIPSQAIAAASA